MAAGTGPVAGPQRGEPDERPRARRPRRKDPLCARACIAFGAVLMVAADGAIVAMDALLSYATRSVAQQDLLGDTRQPGAAQGPRVDQVRQFIANHPELITES